MLLADAPERCAIALGTTGKMKTAARSPSGKQPADIKDDRAERAGRQTRPDHYEHEDGVHTGQRVLVDAMGLIDEVGHRSHPEQSFAIAPACRPTPCTSLNDRLNAFASCLVTRQLCKHRVAGAYKRGINKPSQAQPIFAKSPAANNKRRQRPR